MAEIKDPDHKLVARAKSGNSIAFGELVEKYQDQVLRLAYDYTGDFETARDVAQDIFLKLFLKLSSFSGQSLFSTWLYRVVVNTCLDLKRQTKINMFRLFSLKKELENIPDGLEEINGNDISWIDHQVARLPGQQRMAVILRYFHDKKIAEIADILECSPNTVRTHLSRSFDKLKKSIKPEK